MSYYPLDLLLFFIINIANIVLAIIFLSRVKKPGLERGLGILYIALGIPTLILVILNIYFQREWWFWVFPTIFLIFIGFEIWVDYVKKDEFRKTRKKQVLVPYLLLYYSSNILMWGLTWTLGVFFGAITGITYFLQVGCSFYAIKHGVG